MKKRRKRSTFPDLVRVMARLRGPKGCPWDRQQTHQTLLKYLKEESEEVVAAVQNDDMENLEEELGDVLLQVLFHAQLAAERGDFDVYDVVDTLNRKLVGRHPHVFGRGRKEKLTAEDVKARWADLKAKEKKARKRRRGDFSR